MKTEVAEKSNEEKTTVFVSRCTLLFDTGNKSLTYKTFVIIQVIQQTVFINSLLFRPREFFFNTGFLSEALLRPRSFLYKRVYRSLKQHKSIILKK